MKRISYAVPSRGAGGTAAVNQSPDVLKAEIARLTKQLQGVKLTMPKSIATAASIAGKRAVKQDQLKALERPRTTPRQASPARNAVQRAAPPPDMAIAHAKRQAEIDAMPMGRNKAVAQIKLILSGGSK